MVSPFFTSEFKINHLYLFICALLFTAWPGRLLPAAWGRLSPHSTPTQRPSSSSDTNARPSNRLSGGRTHGRLTDISGITPCTPSLKRWMFTPVSPWKVAGGLPYLLTPWTWVTSQPPWGRTSADWGKTLAVFLWAVRLGKSEMLLTVKRSTQREDLSEPKTTLLAHLMHLALNQMDREASSTRAQTWGDQLRTGKTWPLCGTHGWICMTVCVTNYIEKN